MKKRLAICVSGSLRSFEYCKQSFKKHILDSNKDNFEINLFFFIPEDIYSHKIKLLDIPDVVFEIRKDEIIKYNNKIINTAPIIKKDRASKGGLQGYLQQLKGINSSYNLMKKYEEENNIIFDFVLRCRSDVIFKESVNLSILKNNLITVPKFHSYRGINDRFAFGNRENMSHYMNMYPNILQKNVCFFNAETYCKKNLDDNMVKYTEENILFNRIRVGNNISRDCF